MARSFWLGWWAILIYMVLIGMITGIVGVAVVLIPELHVAPMYLFVGIIMYACDPRYWTMEFGKADVVRQEIRILVLWPVLYPYYFGCLMLAGYQRLRE